MLCEWLPGDLGWVDYDGWGRTGSHGPACSGIQAIEYGLVTLHQNSLLCAEVPRAALLLSLGAPGGLPEHVLMPINFQGCHCDALSTHPK